MSERYKTEQSYTTLSEAHQAALDKTPDELKEYEREINQVMQLFDETGAVKAIVGQVVEIDLPKAA